MFLSVFDMFKVGVGPSSSHTMGPMVAGARFLDALRASPFTAAGLRASLHGSLAFTGKGHATDRATILGLAGFAPDTYNAEKAEAALAAIAATGTVTPPGLRTLAFRPRDRPGLRLRPRPARPCQWDDPDGDRRAGRRDPAGDLLFRSAAALF